MKKLVLMLVFLFMVELASSATISGNVYSWDLQQLQDVKITINTSPQQVHISKDGTYSFQVPIGTYNLTAEYYADGVLDSNANEQVAITEDGEYIIDLILFPEFDVGDDDFEPFEDEKEKPSSLIYILIGLAVLVLIIGILFYKKRKKLKKNTVVPEGKEDLEKILEFIKKEDGRTTQKDIRKAFGLSEAKASLIITELEHKNLVKRIKKGRGNVIILNK